ncbi:MAG: hypothetical protein HYY06_12740 [Deltaproteobacteria bacterium]|nr:hypothetical protein [Deltaproteobacteria bacterium]
MAMLSEDNAVAVYQHRPQRVTSPWLARYAQLLAAAGARVTGYESAQAGMLFATRSEARAGAIRTALTSRLGAVAAERTGLPGRVL